MSEAGSVSPAASGSPQLPCKVAIVLAAGLPPGYAANVAACIAAGLAAGSPGWAGRALADAAGWHTVSSSHLPITVLGAHSEVMAALVRQLADGAAAGGTVLLFPVYAQALHDCDAYWQRHGALQHVNEAMLGVGLAGPPRWVNRTTGSLPLWR